jgi:hypothetical protein
MARPTGLSGIAPRRFPCEREKYEGAKRAAASEYPNDGKAYTSAKEPIIRSLTERAYERGYDERLPDFATEE